MGTRGWLVSLRNRTVTGWGHGGGCGPRGTGRGRREAEEGRGTGPRTATQGREGAKTVTRSRRGRRGKAWGHRQGHGGGRSPGFLGADESQGLGDAALGLTQATLEAMQQLVLGELTLPRLRLQRPQLLQRWPGTAEREGGGSGLCPKTSLIPLFPLKISPPSPIPQLTPLAAVLHLQRDADFVGPGVEGLGSHLQLVQHGRQLVQRVAVPWGGFGGSAEVFLGGQRLPTGVGGSSGVPGRTHAYGRAPKRSLMAWRGCWGARGGTSPLLV